MAVTLRYFTEIRTFWANYVTAVEVRPITSAKGRQKSTSSNMLYCSIISQTLLRNNTLNRGILHSKVKI